MATKGKELAISEVKYTPAQMALVKRTVAKNATDDELAMFLHIAKKNNLDPFNKEIWFIKYGSGDAIIMTGRDGFLKIAQNTGKFEGIQSAAVYSTDDFEIDYTDPIAIRIKHISRPTAKDRVLLGAWCRVRRTGCLDTVEYANFSTYEKKFAGRVGLWQQYPEAMIKKVAESIALKKQFGVTGLVSQEEMGVEPTDEPKKLPKEKIVVDETPKVELSITNTKISGGSGGNGEEIYRIESAIGKILELVGYDISIEGKRDPVILINKYLPAKKQIVKIPTNLPELRVLYSQILIAKNKKNGK